MKETRLGFCSMGFCPTLVQLFISVLFGIAFFRTLMAAASIRIPCNKRMSLHSVSICYPVCCSVAAVCVTKHQNFCLLKIYHLSHTKWQQLLHGIEPSYARKTVEEMMISCGWFAVSVSSVIFPAFAGSSLFSRCSK